MTVNLGCHVFGSGNQLTDILLSRSVEVFPRRMDRGVKIFPQSRL